MNAGTVQNTTLTPRLALLVTAHLFVLERRNLAMSVRQTIHGRLPEGFLTQESHHFGRFHRYLSVSARHMKASGFDGVDWLRDYANNILPGVYHGYHLQKNAMMAWTVRDIVQDIRRSAAIGDDAHPVDLDDG